MEGSLKRTADGFFVRNADDTKFELQHNINIVVSTFQSGIYIHVRRYQDRYPTKEGVCMSPDEWFKVSETLTQEGDRKFNATYGTMMVKRFKNQSVVLTSTNKGTTIAVPPSTITSLKERYV